MRLTRIALDIISVLMATNPTTNTSGKTAQPMKKHVLAYLKSQKAPNQPRHLPFYECLIDVLGQEDGANVCMEKHEVPCTVQYQRDECALMISPKWPTDYNGARDRNTYDLPLLHAGEGCPMRRLAAGDIPQKVLPAYNTAKEEKAVSPRVRVASSILVVSRDGRILLTRRSRNLRSFPSAWVLPGGHVDPFETSLEHAAARELQEETGILLEPPFEEIEPCAVYESAFPATLENGLVKYRHIIMYMIARLDEDHHEVGITSDPEEVDATVWLTTDQLRLVFSSDPNDAEICSKSTFQATVEEDGGRWVSQSLSLDRLRQRTDPITGGLENERISTGVRVAIQSVMEKI